MLVLERKKGSEIRIGDNIVIKIVSVEAGRVRLGIEAPKSVKIVRDDAHPEKVKQNG